jgi:hypothetical protein
MTIKSDGSNQRPLSPEPGFYQHLLWSPYGSELAFIKEYPIVRAAASDIIVDPIPEYDLGILHLDGGNERRLTYYDSWPSDHVWCLIID